MGLEQFHAKVPTEKSWAVIPGQQVSSYGLKSDNRTHKVPGYQNQPFLETSKKLLVVNNHFSDLIIAHFHSMFCPVIES